MYEIPFQNGYHIISRTLRMFYEYFALQMLRKW